MPAPVLQDQALRIRIPEKDKANIHVYHGQHHIERGTQNGVQFQRAAERGGHGVLGSQVGAALGDFGFSLLAPGDVPKDDDGTGQVAILISWAADILDGETGAVLSPEALIVPTAGQAMGVPGADGALFFGIRAMVRLRMMPDRMAGVPDELLHAIA